jgi:hypothetical protein
MNLYSPKFLNSLQKELEQNLKKEFSQLKNKPTQKEIEAFEVYEKSLSLAGMDTWLAAYREFEYFQDILKELLKLKNQQNIHEFREDIGWMLREDFGEEDFRFIEWERTECELERLLQILTQWIFQSKQTLKNTNPNFLPKEQNHKIYLQATDDPSKKGVQVEMVPKKTPSKKIKQIHLAEKELLKLFPLGFELYKELTKKIILVQSPGLVSYSHFQEQGISYINVLDRRLSETIDDLVHENAHHHLNLLLKKYKIFKKLDKSPKYYSPWRNSLRNLYAILHSVFTFSFGAQLFHSVLKTRESGGSNSHLKNSDFEFYRFRFLEETVMLEYSLFDLENNYSQFTEKGKEVIQTLGVWNRNSLKDFPRNFNLLKEKSLKKEINDLQKKLELYRIEFSYAPLDRIHNTKRNRNRSS